MIADEADTTSTRDVVVAGGGLVGGSLAVALHLAGARVTLVEAVPHDSAAQPSFDDRSLALSRSSCSIIQGLGLWPQVTDAVFPVSQIHVSEQGRFGTALIDASQQGIDSLGFVIRGRDMGAALWQRIGELEGLEVRCPARVTASSVTNGHRRVIVECEDGRDELLTRLLVVADGARSPLRDALDIVARERDYHQVAIVANVQVADGYAGSRAFERFTPDGPLALLPGRGGRYTAVLARPAEAAETLLALDDSEYLALLQQCLGFRAGRLQRLGQRVAYPLTLVKAEALTAPRAVVVGNAAHGLHPVAGQGFNLGLRDVAALAELLADARRDAEPLDAGAPALLESYADWREADQQRVVAFTDGLIRGFGLQSELVGTGRGLGLALFDLAPAAKRELARQTMGLAGRMSRLSRGLPL